MRTEHRGAKYLFLITLSLLFSLVSTGRVSAQEKASADTEKGSTVKQQKGQGEAGGKEAKAERSEKSVDDQEAEGKQPAEREERDAEEAYSSLPQQQKGEPQKQPTNEQAPKPSPTSGKEVRFFQESDSSKQPSSNEGNNPDYQGTTPPPIFGRPAQKRSEPRPRKRGNAGAPFALALSFGTLWNTDSGFDLFLEDDEDTITWGGMWGSYDIVSVTRRLILAAEIGFWIGNASDYNDILEHSEWEYHETKLYAAANLRYVVLPWFQPHLRLEAGRSYTKLKAYLESQSGSGQKIEDGTVSPFASLGLGVTLRTPTRLFETRSGNLSSLSLGLMVEGGYSIASSAELSIPSDGDDDRIETRSADLGEIDLSGPFIKISLVVRF